MAALAFAFLAGGVSRKTCAAPCSSPFCRQKSAYAFCSWFDLAARRSSGDGPPTRNSRAKGGNDPKHFTVFKKVPTNIFPTEVSCLQTRRGCLRYNSIRRHFQRWHSLRNSISLAYRGPSILASNVLQSVLSRTEVVSKSQGFAVFAGRGRSVTLFLK
jgi:hypothetical protein